MGAKFTLEGSVVEYFLEVNDGSIEVRLDQSVCLPVATPFSFDTRVELEDFNAFLLLSPDIKENDVKEVYNKITGDRARVGWAIPVLSLVSAEHDFARNEHFLRYAQVAILKSLEVADESYSLKADNLEALDLVELLGENAVILVISKGALRDGHGFDLSRAMPSLVSQGYIAAMPDVDATCQWVDRSVVSRNIKIMLSAKVPADHDMVTSMLCGFVSSTRSSALQFFYLYQIIELLMERVIDIRRQEIADSIVNAGINSSSIKNALEKIGEINSERSRINLVVDRYARAAGDLDGLKAACNRLKVTLNMESGDGIAEYLYPIRNYIFHNFRSFPKEAELELRLVVSALLLAIPVLLSKFDDSRD